MAIALDNNKVYEVVVRGRVDGQNVLNILHYQTDEPLGQITGDDTLENFSTRLSGVWGNAILPYVSDRYEVEEWLLSEISKTMAGNPNPSFISHIVYEHQISVLGSFADAGEVAGECLPSYAAVGFRKVTAMRGRGKRGSIRIGGIPEDYTTLNSLNATGQAAFLVSHLDPLLDIQISAPGSVHMKLCIFQKTAAQRSAGTINLRPFTERVTNFILNPLITSQVSRKRRVGKGA